MSDDDASMRKHLTRLSELEHQVLGKIPPEDRPCELALLRFEDERRKLGAPITVPVRNAFRMGYRAAIADQKGA